MFISWLSNIQLCVYIYIYTIFFIHSSVLAFGLHLYLGYCKYYCCEHWVACIFSDCCFHFFVDNKPKSGTDGLWVLYFSFLRKHCTVFLTVCTNLHSQQKYMSVPFTMHPLQHLFIDFIMASILTSVSSYLIAVLIYIPHN